MQVSKLKIPKCDILVHTGDFTYDGSIGQLQREVKALAKVVKGKTDTVIAIAGNHDRFCQQFPDLAKQVFDDNGITYLCDSWCVAKGLTIYGSPYTHEFCGWAFPLYNPDECIRKWSNIPDNTNILLTHGPCLNIGDSCPDGYKAGCNDLFHRTCQLKDLKLFVCGHIHGGYGIKQFDGKVYVNASSCTERYECTNEPIVIDVEL
jgi:Icc-related predicted phosphoesterase